MRSRRFALLAAALTVGAGHANAETLFGLVDTGELFVSADRGASWSVRSALPVRDAVGLVRGETENDLVLASRSGGVWVSEDAGTSWAARGTVAAANIVAVDVGVRAGVALLLLSESGTVWESLDGFTFSSLATLMASDHVDLTHDAQGNLYALARTGVVRTSADGGVAWSARGAIPISDGVDVESFGSDLFVLTGAGDVWSSADAGSSWVPAGTLSQVHMSAMTLGESGALYASTREGEVATSGDGASWQWVGLINQLNVTALATDAPPTGVGVLPPPFSSVSLSAPWPNPRRGFGGSDFRFTLPEATTVRFVMVDVAGRRAATREPEWFPAGAHQVHWDPGVRVSGTYYVRLKTDSGRSAGTRWVLLR